MISQFSKNLNLTTYLIADRPSFDSEKEFFHKVEKVVDAGIGSVQFRDLKNPYLTREQLQSRMLSPSIQVSSMPASSDSRRRSYITNPGTY